MKTLKYFACCLILNLLPLKIHAQPQQLLRNTFISDVQFNYQQNILCVGTYWISTYPKVAQKLNQDLEYLWPNNEYGVLLTNPTGNDETWGGFMLPQDDGSVIYYFSYGKFVNSGDPGEYLYNRYPSVQKVDADGNVLWGENGIRLSNHKAVWDLMASIGFLNMSYDTDGNINFFWTPGYAENEERTEEVKGTFMQKIDPVSGELLYDSTGIKIIDESAVSVLEGKDNNYFIFKMPASSLIEPEIINVNEDGNIIWSITPFEDERPYGGIAAHINSKGDIQFILYKKLWYIYASGEVKFKDRVIEPWHDNAFFSKWENDKRISVSNKDIYFYNLDGELTLVININLPEHTILHDFKLLSDTSSILILYTTVIDSGSFNHVLMMQKISMDSASVLQEEGVVLIEKSASRGHILPDNNGGAYIIANALTLYEPEYRPRGSYIFKIDENGNIITKVPINLHRSNDTPGNFILVKNYPNPFSEYTNFIIQNNNIMHYKPTKLIIYNILGKEVRNYEIDHKNLTNRIELSWDGKDQFGRRVTPGVYFYHLLTNDYSTMANGKLILVK